MAGNMQTVTAVWTNTGVLNFITDNVHQILYCWASQILRALSKLMLQVHRRVGNLFFWFILYVCYANKNISYF
jgi:hypothetical protein